WSPADHGAPEVPGGQRRAEPDEHYMGRDHAEIDVGDAADDVVEYRVGRCEQAPEDEDQGQRERHTAGRPPGRPPSAATRQLAPGDVPDRERPGAAVPP